MSEDSQLLARSNGEWGEHEARRLLARTFPDLEYIQGLVDFCTSSGIPIEVKTCQDRIDAFPSGRQGRYLLMQDQHEELLARGGFYFFLVKSGSLLIKAKLVPADWVSFKRQIPWRSIHE